MTAQSGSTPRSVGVFLWYHEIVTSLSFLAGIG